LNLRGKEKKMKNYFTFPSFSLQPIKWSRNIPGVFQARFMKTAIVHSEVKMLLIQLLIRKILFAICFDN
jgi:hypothetical protein